MGKEHWKSVSWDFHKILVIAAKWWNLFDWPVKSLFQVYPKVFPRTPARPDTPSASSFFPNSEHKRQFHFDIKQWSSASKKQGIDNEKEKVWIFFRKTQSPVIKIPFWHGVLISRDWTNIQYWWKTSSATNCSMNIWRHFVLISCDWVRLLCRCLLPFLSSNTSQILQALFIQIDLKRHSLDYNRLTNLYTLSRVAPTSSPVPL